MADTSQTQLPRCHRTYRSGHRAGGWPRSQAGIALVVALILLVVITLVGLAAIRGTTIQQKMTSNFYDRQIAFQGAEAALRAAVASIENNTDVIARNCGQGGVTCYDDPFVDPNLPSGSVQTVPSGSGTSDFTIGANAAGQPQYVIENMGTWTDTNFATGFNETANAAQYGAQGVSYSSLYYRITARSGDPSTVGDRAVVTLQAMFKQ